ncbi:putative Ig domain-containing protein [Larkinella sp. C7]|uniref:putative Ig domain-containing protein n=1 Tax=Larkinella sp. C7 TaxID=2576607 RepID=UPI001E41C644|nr:putative Ig domain-containing protein [Larkinella sp. C7]
MDTSFDPGSGADNIVFSVAVLESGKALVGGQFTQFNGTTRNGMVRLNTDGSLDTDFDPNAGVNARVQCMTVQGNGKILIGGAFTRYDEIFRSCIARINANGSLDTDFDPGSGANNELFSLVLQPDGDILMGGTFVRYNGTTCNRIARLTSSPAPLTLSGFGSPSASVCVGAVTTFTATVGNITGSYAYTLTNGIDVTRQGTSTNPAFSENITIGSSTSPQAFTLTVNNAGVSKSATVLLTVNPLPNAAFSGLGTSYCADVTPVTLIPTTAGGIFSGPGVSGTTFSPSNAGNGGAIMYTVTVNGCANSSTRNVVVNPVPTATISPSSATLTCASPTVSLTASGGGTYRWENNSTNAVRTVTTAGTYSVTVTAGNGCSATASVTITGNTSAPTVSISPSNPVLSCASPSVSLSAVGSGAVLWSNGATTPTIAVTTAGTYSVTLTSGNGCSATAWVMVSGNTAAPERPNLISTTVTQGDPAITLTASNCTGILAWDGPDGTTGTGPISVPTVTPGSFVYQATCVLNGCMSEPGSATVVVSSRVVTGSFEGFVYGADCSSFRGWVWDRNQPNTAISVDILEGTSVITTLMADQLRPDLAEAGKGNGKHAFRWAIPEALKDGASHSLWARVTGNGFALKDGPKTIRCQTANPEGNQPPLPPASISPLIAQVEVSFSATLPVFSDPEGEPLTYGLTGLPTSLQFNAETRTITGTPTEAGSWTLNYQSTDAQNARVSIQIQLTVNPSSTAPVAGNFEGYLDKVECESIRGWVWDRNKPHDALTVEFLADGQSIGSVRADIFRQDLKEAGKGNGYHVYSFPTPASVKTGRAVSISARVLGSAYVLKQAPKSLTCPSSEPPVNHPPLVPVVSPLVATVNTALAVTLPAFTDPEGSALTYTLTGLPVPLHFTAANRLLDGTPLEAGSYTLFYEATDGQGSSSRLTISLVVNPASSDPVTGSFEGFLDKLDCGGIRGWVWDRNKPNTPLTVEFYLEPSPGNVTVLGSTVGSIFRQDLKDAGKGNGAHAYNFTPPSSMANGTQVFARVLGSTYQLKGSPKAFQCNAPARLSAEEDPQLQVTVLGNPVSREQVVVEVRGGQGQPLRLVLFDPKGQLVTERVIGQTQAVEHQTLVFGARRAGLLLLQVISGQQTRTVKVLIP